MSIKAGFGKYNGNGTRTSKPGKSVKAGFGKAPTGAKKSSGYSSGKGRK